jgi:hypothetical protein
MMISTKAIGLCVAAVCASFLLTRPAVAAEFDWKPCKAEIEKFCKGVAGDEKLWACLEKNDEKLSKTCDAAHGKYEEQTGRAKR